MKQVWEMTLLVSMNPANIIPPCAMSSFELRLYMCVGCKNTI